MPVLLLALLTGCDSTQSAQQKTDQAEAAPDSQSIDAADTDPDSGPVTEVGKPAKKNPSPNIHDDSGQANNAEAASGNETVDQPQNSADQSVAGSQKKPADPTKAVPPMPSANTQTTNTAIGQNNPDGLPDASTDIAAEQAKDTNMNKASDPATLAKDLQSAVGMLADASPGTTIVVPEGTYTLKQKLDLKATGKEGQPVTLMAENANVRIAGRAGFDIASSNWLVIDGFTLSHQGRTTNVEDSNNVRFTRMKFQLLQNPAIDKKPDVTTHWLRFREGTGHRVDHSEFGPHPGGLGVTLVADNSVDSIRIDHNYFHDRERDGRNGAETIRVGSGGGSAIAAVIEDNLFERCNGEVELISIKSDGTVIRYNTFRDNHGFVVVRNGRDAIINGNYFIGTDPKTKSGGVRVHGRNLCVVQNYFAGLSTPALQTFPGTFTVPDTSNKTAFRIPRGGYPQTTDVVFAGNLIIDDLRNAKNADTLAIIDSGSSRETSGDNILLSESWTIINNLSLSDGSLLGGPNIKGAQTNNNIFRSITSPKKTGDSDKMPDLHNDNGLWRLVDQSNTTPQPGEILEGCQNPTLLMPVNLPAPRTAPASKPSST